MRKSLILLLCLSLLLFSFPSVAAATDSEITPLWNQILRCQTVLDIDSNGIATLRCVGSGAPETTKVVIKAKLQRSGGLFWTTVETFSIEENSFLATINESCNVASGYSYRIKATFTIYSETDSDSTTIKSNVVEF